MRALALESFDVPPAVIDAPSPWRGRARFWSGFTRPR